MFKLRDYQQEAIDATLEYFETHKGNPLVVMPTGSGKSICIAGLIKQILDEFQDVRIVVVTHVKELVKQDFDTMSRFWPESTWRTGICSAGLSRRDTRAQILFAGIQTIAKRSAQVGHIDLLIIDEAHRLPKTGEGMYRRFIADSLEVNDKMRVVGFTATPYRTDSGLLTKGKDKIFTSVCYDAKIEKLVDDGWLSPFTTKISSTQYDISGITTKGGDFDQVQLARMLTESEMVTSQAIDEIVVEGESRKQWLLFCGSVEQSKQAREMLRVHGICAESVDGELDRGTRDRLISQYRSGGIRALTSVNVLTTGFDVPSVDLIAMLRPTKSPGLYVQIIGRGSRLAPGKKDCLVLDFGGNIARHGPINNVSVPVRKGKGDAPIKMCPRCLFEEVPAGSLECPECSFQFPPREIELETRSQLEVIQKKTPEKWFNVTDVRYRRHHKEGKPDSMRVIYYAGLGEIASEWICLEHEGFARSKAFRWMEERMSGDEAFPPCDIETAIEQGPLIFKKPSRIMVEKEGRYRKVAGYDFV